MYLCFVLSLNIQSKGNKTKYSTRESMDYDISDHSVICTYKRSTCKTEKQCVLCKAGRTQTIFDAKRTVICKISCNTHWKYPCNVNKLQSNVQMIVYYLLCYLL